MDLLAIGLVVFSACAILPPLFDLVFGYHWHVLAFADRERVDNTKAVANE
ncbi:hypothetical protein [Vibrio rotiferianus]